MKNPPHSFRQINLALQLVQKSWIKSKIFMSYSSRKKKKAFFLSFILYEGNFITCFISMYSVLINIQNKYTFTYPKTLLH